MRERILISGAAGGLGKAFCAACAERGYDLILTDQSEDNLKVLAEGLRRAYRIRVDWIASDLMDSDARLSFLEQVKAFGENLTGLICVAGIDYEGGITERSLEELRAIRHVNIESTVELAYGVLRQRRNTDPFHLIMVCSLAAFQPMPFKATYAASKSFLLQFALALREEMRPTGVTVTALCPAGMPTNQECRQAIDAQGLMGRLTTCNVGDVAEQALDCCWRGKAIVIPGFLNKVLCFLTRLAPAPLIARMVYHRWAGAINRKGGNYICPVE